MKNLSIIFWAHMVLLVNVLDVVSTALGLKAGLREGNPLMAGLLAFPWAMLTFKFVSVAGFMVGIILEFSSRGNKDIPDKSGEYLMKGFAAGLWFVVYSNTLMTIMAYVLRGFL